MGLFNKKKGVEENLISLPDLPETEEDLNLPSIDDLSAPANLPDLEINNLPSLENHSNNQSQIKTAINHPVKKPLGDATLTPIGGMQKSKFKVIESPEEGMPVRLGNDALKIYPNNQINNFNFNKSHTKEIEPIYVRLDKFQTTVGAFQEIKSKVEDIEKLLTKIKEIKEKEERELNEWENEIQIIKSRIESVDKNIFDKLN